MFSKQNLKQVKWISIIGAILNIVLLGILIGSLVAFQNVIPYRILIYISVIDLAFSLLLISTSLRIDQIFYRLKWVNMLCSSLSLAVVLSVFFLGRNSMNQTITINWPLYVLLALAILFMFGDVVIIKLKYRNNPFYHNGQFKKNVFTTYQDVTPKKKVDDVVVEDRSDKSEPVEQEVLDKNLSYYEVYQMRSKELQQTDDDFDNGVINEQEYQKRRKDIYAKYDKYN